VTSRCTILIADDEPAVRQLIRVSLTGRPYRLLEAQRPAVAILDIRMPGRDGLALTRAIRADPALARTRVILLTGLLGADMEAQGLAAGADHYLTKPFWPQQLLATIAACLRATE
jgi:CheY-like chemotaxis protein